MMTVNGLSCICSVPHHYESHRKRKRSEQRAAAEMAFIMNTKTSMRRKLCSVILCPVERVDTLQMLLVPDLYSACTSASITWVLAFPRSGMACGQ